MSLASRLLPALVLSSIAATSAGAVVPLQTSVSVSPGAAVSSQGTAFRSMANGSVTNTPVNLLIASVNIGRFAPNMGILVGATVNVTGVATAVNARVAATLSSAISGTGRFATSTVELNGSVSGTGFTTISNASAVATRTCDTIFPNVCSQSVSFATVVAGPDLAGSAAVSSGSLGSYYGAGSVALSRNAAGSVQITNGNQTTGGRAIGTYGMVGGTYGITYDHLNFASPSFDGGLPVLSSILDFGVVDPDDGPFTLNFSLFNIGNDNSAGVSLVSITRDFNTAEFTSDAASFVDLAGGGSDSFSVTFAPTYGGSFSDVFRFNLADYAPGGVGGKNYALDLTVMGAAIPEPSTWATLMLGFAMIGVAVRSRRKKAVAA